MKYTLSTIVNYKNYYKNVNPVPNYIVFAHWKSCLGHM